MRLHLGGDDDGNNSQQKELIVSLSDFKFMTAWCVWVPDMSFSYDEAVN
jgi:hypothetical protein